MTEIVQAGWARSITGCAVALFGATAAADIARADSPLNCVKVEHFIEAIQDYKRPYTEAEIAAFDEPRRLATGGNPERYSVPGLFELTRNYAAGKSKWHQDRGTIPINVKAQGHSHAFEIGVRAVGFMAGDVGRGCLDNSKEICSGEEWLLIGSEATVLLFYQGSNLQQRSPSMTVHGTVNCKPGDDIYFIPDAEAVEAMKRLLKGPRTP